MKSAEFAGAIGSLFGNLPREVWDGELMRSVGTGLAPESRRSRWTPTTIVKFSGQGRSRDISPSRQWSSGVPRDHSRSRYGNQRP